jgi:hypothetical protein
LPLYDKSLGRGEQLLRSCFRLLLQRLEVIPYGVDGTMDFFILRLKTVDLALGDPDDVHRRRRLLRQIIDIIDRVVVDGFERRRRRAAAGLDRLGVFDVFVGMLYIM